MTKKEIKNILMAIRTHDNGVIVNNLLGKIDVLNEEYIQEYIEKIGSDEESIRKFFEDKIAEMQNSQSEEKFPINDMYTYGINGNCIHLHLPVDLRTMLKERGASKTMATVDLNLLDAIDRIAELKAKDFYRFQGKDEIYMISPILSKKGLGGLKDLDFQTRLYKLEDLNNLEFRTNNPEAVLAYEKFIKNSESENVKSVGAAAIDFKTIFSKEWQEKKNKKVQDLTQKVGTLQGISKDKE